MPEATPDHDLLIRIETKLDLYISQGNDHETRIKLLESRDSALNGALTSGKLVWGLLALMFVVGPTFLNIFLQTR